MAKLVVLSEGLTGRSYELKVDKTTIGRLDDNAFQIAEPSVSSHHCEVLLKGSDVIVKDLGSTNGTFVNGEQVKEQTERLVKPGQILRLGSVEMRLETEASAAAAAAATAAKKDQNTKAIPRGVKFGGDAVASAPVIGGKNSAFTKKTNKANKVFIGVGVILGLIIVAMLIMAFMNMKGEG